MMRHYLALKRTLYLLAQPKSSSEDDRRHEFILNVMLLGVLALSATALVQVCVGMIMAGAEYGGASPLVVGTVMFVLLGLYGLSRGGHAQVAAYVFIACFTAIAAGVGVVWGISLSTGVLLFALVLIMSGTLIGTRFSVAMMGVIAVIILVLGYMESRHIVKPDLSWMQVPVGLNDSLGYIGIWGVITLVTWLSNREIERSLRRARASEAALAKQRDLLEVRVEERTRELKQAQLEKILQLNRFADFGRISSGFFHDIINPLTAVSLNLEQLSLKKRSELLQQAIAGIRHIEGFAMAARKQVQGHTTDLQVFQPAEEIREVVSVLENKARGARVSISCELENDARLYGSPVKFHQLISNLVANAIDAYENTNAANRTVIIRLKHSGRRLEIVVKDHGAGISREHLDVIFDPFFTTKPVDRGTGIGLLIVKRAVEEDFYGSIKVVSAPGKGAAFTVKLPSASTE